MGFVYLIEHFPGCWMWGSIIDLIPVGKVSIIECNLYQHSDNDKDSVLALGGRANNIKMYLSFPLITKLVQIHSEPCTSEGLELSILRNSNSLYNPTSYS